jgi:hypothetical protein
VEANSSKVGAAALLKMLGALTAARDVGGLSVAVYTQVSDVELECDGMFTYDRLSHFSDQDAAAIRTANRKLTGLQSEQVP